MKADNIVLHIRHFDTRDGLPDQSVLCVASDERGLIWVGTGKGLSRYDGHEFKSYYSSDGLRQEAVWKIIPHGRKLVLLHRIGATEKFSPQLDLFDIYDEQVTPFESFFDNTLPFDWEQVLHCEVHTNDQLAFFLEDGTRYRFTLGEQRWQVLTFPSEETLIAAGSNGHYWTYSTSEGGLVLNWYTSGQASSLIGRQFIPGQPLLRHLPGSDRDTALFLILAPLAPRLFKVWLEQDSVAWGWAPTNLDQLKQHIQAFDRFAIFNELQYLPTLQMYWAVSDSQAVLLFERTNELLPLTNVPIRHLSSWLRSNLVQGHTIWQCSHDGLYQIDLKSTPFQRAFTNLTTKTGFRGIQALQGQLYFNCHQGAIPFQQKDAKQLKPIVPLALSSTTDHKGRLWTGNFNSLFEYDPAKSVIQRYSIPLHEPWSLYADTSGYIWMSNMGLYRFAPQSATTIKIRKPGLPQLDNSIVYHFFEEQPGKVWLCGTTGLYLFNPYTQDIRRYGPEEPGNFRLPARDFRHLYFDSLSNTFWLATADQGLLRWDRNSYKTETFNFRAGKSQTLHSVYPDTSGYLWLSSEHGLIQFAPGSGQYRVYTMRDGLNTKEFNRISHYQDKDGTLYFGSLDGVTYFHPQNFADALNPEVEARPQVVEALQYLGKENQVMDVTDTYINQGAIVFRPRDRFLTLILGMEDVRLGQGTTYKYKLNRQGEEWANATDHTITLGRLPYGRQTLLVQAQLENGTYSAEPLEVLIFVKRPFYLRWWFLLSVTVLGILGIYGRTRQLDRRNRELEAEVRKRTEIIAKDREVIRQQAEELRQLDELKSRFFANLSHELRTPLTLILSPLSQLLEKENRPALRPLIELAHQQSRKILRLVNDIMDLARLESTTLEVRRAATPLLPLLKQLTSNFELHASREAIRLELDYGLAESLCLQLDAQKTETILYNYLANAIKFTPEGGLITLSARKVEDTLHFEVCDTGRGIPAADLPHIFERYYQSRVFKAVEGGSGLGLALSRELATLLGGKVWAESEAGAGSRLFLQLPWVEAEPANPLASGNSTGTNMSVAFVSPGDPRTSYRVLIVEDHHDMRNYLLQLLSFHFEVEAVSNGQAALSYLEQSAAPPDLILSDVMMPEMDGYELLHHLKQSDAFSHIPVVMLTARSAMADRLKALRIGVDDYLTKPFVEEELLTRIRNLLRHATMRLPEQEEDTLSDNRTAVAPEKATVRQVWLEKAETIVRTHLSEQQFSVDFVAAQMGLSRHTLNRKLRQHTGLTTSQYIQEVRLDYARKLLENSKVDSVTKLAEACGMRDPKYFSRLFKERFGQPPSYYL